MDQKTLAEKDPKLHEDFKRVMDTPLPTNQPDSPNAPLPEEKKRDPQQPPTPLPQANPEKPKGPYYTFHAGGAAKKASSGNATWVFIIVGGIIFFICYAYLWIRLFKVELPISLPF